MAVSVFHLFTIVPATPQRKRIGHMVYLFPSYQKAKNTKRNKQPSKMISNIIRRMWIKNKNASYPPSKLFFLSRTGFVCRRNSAGMSTRIDGMSSNEQEFQSESAANHVERMRRSKLSRASLKASPDQSRRESC